MPINLINEKELNVYLTKLVWHDEDVPLFPTTSLKDQSEQVDFLTPVDLNQPNLPAWVNGVREQKGSVYQFDAEKYRHI